jgi:hypothetical protein
MNTVDIPRKPSAFGQANMILSVSSAAGPTLAGKLMGFYHAPPSLIPGE